MNPRIRLQLNVEKFSDERYYVNTDSNTNISPGVPRSIRVGITRASRTTWGLIRSENLLEFQHALAGVRPGDEEALSPIVTGTLAYLVRRDHMTGIAV